MFGEVSTLENFCDIDDFYHYTERIRNKKMQKHSFVQNKPRVFYKVEKNTQLYHSANQEDKSQLFLEMLAGQNYCRCEEQGDPNVKLIGEIYQIQWTIILKIG